jgi:hypothetical protein
MNRCFDCFHEFGPDEDRFAVLKQAREVPVNIPDNAEGRMIYSLSFDQVFICADCAGWYGDHPIQVTAFEASR